MQGRGKIEIILQRGREVPSGRNIPRNCADDDPFLSPQTSKKVMIDNGKSYSVQYGFRLPHHVAESC